MIGNSVVGFIVLFYDFLRFFRHLNLDDIFFFTIRNFAFNSEKIFIRFNIIQIRVSQKTFGYGKIMQRIYHIGFPHAVVAYKTVDLW